MNEGVLHLVVCAGIGFVIGWIVGEMLSGRIIKVKDKVIQKQEDIIDLLRSELRFKWDNTSKKEDNKP
jgi:hypothetical protein